MLPRLALETLLRRLSEYPAVALIGPRQCGKTTLARSLSSRYYDLEQVAERLRLDLEWADVSVGRDLVVCDEAQSWPDLFAKLRGAIDEDRKRNGRFLLLGSVSPALMTQVFESLAGRLSIVELTPLLWSELETQAQRDRRWLCGGYADGGVLAPGRYPRWQLDYLTLLTQRDLPAWGLPAKPQTTDRLLRMLAALHGQVWNASQVGQSMGLSYHTVNSYLDHLIGAFLLRRIAPLEANVRKRLVKSPRIYWRDSGLVHALLGVADRIGLLAQPWVGASWEGFVIDQILGQLSALGRVFTPHYFRTSDGQELDLVLELGGELWAFEMKLTASPGPEDMKRVERTARLIGATRFVLVSQTRRPLQSEHRASLDVDGVVRLLRESS
jgi:predicted AAA+ superfamily ATPase